MKIKVINGPNLNMLGIREPGIYGTLSYEALVDFIRKESETLKLDVDISQSNSEGAIIDMLQQAYFDGVDALIINAGAYTHYSYAIRDAIAILKCPVYEVHLSDIYAREPFRHVSVIKEVCTEQITGYGFDSYKIALSKAAKLLNSINSR